ncbi:multi-sensor hybrid histidine kinase [Pseudopedobacter saltans DSM 12145]|uniref:histidine kinase n=1 Tax=Pseudopedobacter saltans (strain ATCC 51119 / DSM 12145 / JCM 21818 / CCUG 39354 / LMG 10337 / NBRC 100064 / NCIMB 13643) TaxID=762903 RepID=F0S7K3_PSESL|nr:response regulator [Pseudopedobacter saltans]ADY52263.1 multi-sensor hybrid histidine kinase [Pseudopedobacter saltans DSM 12145]
MDKSIRKRLFFGISASLILIAFVQIFAYLSLKGVEKEYDWVLHTEKVISENNQLVALMSEAEANHRGYLLRGYDIFYQEYQKNIRDIEDSCAILRELVSDNKRTLQRVDKLQSLVVRKVKVMEDLLDIKKNRYKGEKSESELAEDGITLMRSIKSESGNLKRDEHNLLEQRKANTNRALSRSVIVIIIGTILILVIVFLLFKIIRSAFEEQMKARKEIDEVNSSLADLNKKNEAKNWLLTGISLLNDKLQGDLSVQEMSENIVTSIAQYSGGKIGAIYVVNQDNRSELRLTSGYGLTIGEKMKTRFDISSDGWVAQVAKNGKETIIQGNLAANLEIESGLIKESPLQCILVPFSYNGKLKGVLEIGFTEEISESSKDFIVNSSQLLGVAINTAESRETLKVLFEQTQQQAEELESQQEELRVSNEELLSKTELLQASEEELRVQQEELRQINIELEEKAKVLENSNMQIESAKNTLSIKMQELEQASKYKSEFLANMSHELRTPLNSILILAKILKENKKGHLSEDETKYASVIHRAGGDLLSLINDILDLSKIESGFIELNPENLSVADLEDDLKQLFDEVANTKGVNFVIERDPKLPETIYVDRLRIEQILKNLLSNAFKFTSKEGTVSVHMSEKDDFLRFSVKDTGIGIPEDKQKIIFEAFQQADGSTNREYGGTGLGLSISRELSKLMDGHISLKSEVGKGSEFTLNIPTKELVKKDSGETDAVEQVKSIIADISDKKLQSDLEKNNLIPRREKPLLLIVEDDVVFNDLLKDYAEKGGFDTVQYYSGEGVVHEIENHLPDAILLDVMLPGIDGWHVLKEIKNNQNIAHIPVHIMSAGDFSDKKAQKEGAISFLKKPLDYSELDKIFKNYLNRNTPQALRKVLLVEDQKDQSDALKALFKDKNIDVVQALSGKEALSALNNESFDCVILDLNLPDINGMDLLAQIKEKDKKVPVIINTAMELEPDKLKQLLKYSDATVLKSPKSGDRLIDEVNLFLHKVKETEPARSNRKAVALDESDSALKNKTVLLVDDDMRNIFSISAVLDQCGLKVEIANDGVEALERLEELQKVDIVLMDIMMPRMDGYETMENIRKNIEWKNLPIIALTAKAMKDDREKCISAGANDYITKPIDNDQLISIMKIWIA